MWWLYIIFGALGGILGGMGMGGGTLLIPLLTIFTETKQKEAQGINLIVFIPMAIIALIIHFKNKLVNVKKSVFIIIIIIAIKAAKQIIIPKIAAIARGKVVKATIPSMAYLNSFQKDHFVSPATLSTFS